MKNFILIFLLMILSVPAFAQDFGEINQPPFFPYPDEDWQAAKFDDLDDWLMSKFPARGDIAINARFDTTKALASDPRNATITDTVIFNMYGKIYSLSDIDSVMTLIASGRDSARIWADYRLLTLHGEKFAVGPWAPWGTVTMTKPRYARAGFSGSEDSTATLSRPTASIDYGGGTHIQFRYRIDNLKATKAILGEADYVYTLFDSYTSGDYVYNYTWTGSVTIKFANTGGK